MSFMDDLKSGKFSVYAQWVAMLSALLLIILGIVEFLRVPIFSILGFVFTVLIIFMEISFLTKCCPTSPTFDNFIKKLSGSHIRAGVYLVFAIVMWLSLIQHFNVLFIPALTLTFTAIFYATGYFKGQERTSTSMMPGAGRFVSMV
ncbi:golgi apparatus membrane protein TVP18 [Basidiobolus meristosporus CBS 931.73]|uniref:Golgi apparatus membrane protein TVP18 n=1 Tax=Basidiobolus meristosporus CBS 931.73 TaxID=1314790 RepID=A0A1Y1XT12_9FUNG|nr:golgi apparatus membrane protein TVP18 [Basidiobolus meristosporus CBS 931.73]ORX88444.1 golgi apparatus membrane protein TVP18 [Basidiobolus meristosporus CBS 931.73]|eukprot:ORX75270.1 golgi apparatus membrane protein TVP18 [Basidiobolus meristosporus CBS 931.73]